MLNLTKLLAPNEREVKRHLMVAAAINELEPKPEALDDAALRARSDDLRQRARDGHGLDELLIEAFPVCREAAPPPIGARHCAAQLAGGKPPHQGNLDAM